MASLRVSTHEPLQLVEPEAQLSVHLPCEQVSVAPHLVPQAPQFVASATRLAHPLPQAAYPESHTMAHLPVAQAAAPWAGSGHFVPQAPQ